MQRLDPQDAGPAYRNVIGLPGGVKSPLFKILEVTFSPPSGYLIEVTKIEEAGSTNFI